MKQMKQNKEIVRFHKGIMHGLRESYLSGNNDYQVWLAKNVYSGVYSKLGFVLMKSLKSYRIVRNNNSKFNGIIITYSNFTPPTKSAVYILPTRAELLK